MVILNRNSFIIGLVTVSAVIVQVGCGSNASKRQLIGRSNKPVVALTNQNALTNNNLALTNVNTALATALQTDAKFIDAMRAGNEIKRLEIPTGNYKLNTIASAYYEKDTSAMVEFMTTAAYAVAADASLTAATKPTMDGTAKSEDQGAKLEIPLAFSVGDTKAVVARSADKDIRVLNETSKATEVKVTLAEADLSVQSIMSYLVNGNFLNDEKANGIDLKNIDVKFFRNDDQSLRIFVAITESDPNTDQGNLSIIRYFALDYKITSTVVDPSPTVQ